MNSIKCASNILVGISTAALLVGLSVLPASADFISSTLGAAAGFAVLEIGTGGNVSIANASGAGFINGNVGVRGTSSGNFGDSGTPITGALFLGGSQTANLSGGPRRQEVSLTIKVRC